MSRALPAPWFRALTLGERRDLFRNYLGSGAEISIQQTEAARVTQDLWREVPSLAEDASFHALLKSYELTPQEFVQLLNVPPEELAHYLDAAPEWLTFALDSLNRDLTERQHQGAAQEPVSRLLSLVEPIAIEGGRRLEDELSKLEEHYNTPLFDRQRVLDEYRSVVHEGLLEVVIKPLVVEMHIASRSGALHSNDPTARFDEFIAQLAEPGTTELFLDLYPVIVRIAANQVLQVVATISEMMSRICCDWSVLEHHFSHGPNLGPLKTLKLGLGDPHRGGRTVAQLEFATGVQVIYKPRSVAIDLLFQKLLSSVSHKVGTLPFRFPVLIDLGPYGYMEFVEHRPCNSREEVQRFFYRHGVQLGILYVLGGTDFHLENVVAWGEHPVLVDLETLLVPSLRPRFLRPAEVLAETALRESVLGSGLLPYKIKVDPELESVDLSGLGGVSGQIGPLRIQTWHAVGTDLMHMKREKGLLPTGANLPTLPQEQLTPLEFSPDIVTGFSDAFAALRDSQTEIAQLLRDCTNVPVRAVLRSTYEYAFILGESHHPYHLGDALDRDRFFDQLWASVESKPELQHVYLAEKSDLWKGDIPLFTAFPASRSLWTSSGYEIPSFFDTTGVADTQQRLGKLTEENLSRQVGFIHSALTASAASRGVSFRNQRLKLPFRESPMAAALAIGDHLSRQAFVSGDEATWISMLETDPAFHAPVVAGNDLYAGLPGIVLFLAYLGHVSGQKEYGELARAGLNNFVAGIRQRDRSKLSCGAFDGVGGVIYALTHFGVLFADESLFALADDYIDKARELVNPSSDADVVGGAAGCVLALLVNHSVRKNEAAFQVAQQYGNLLLAQGVDTNGGRWCLPHDVRSLLAGGFGHGSVGIVYSLRKLYIATMEQRYAGAADEALGHLYGIDPTLRAEVLGELSDSWCRGLSGCIGALIRMLPYSTNDWLSSAVDSFIEGVSNEKLIESDCMCHGEMGNLDAALGAELWSSGRRWSGSAMQRAQKLLARAATEGWACGLPVESPSLMDGLAGIGYQLLRIIAPDRVPSILFLEPPMLRRPSFRSG